MELSHRLWWVIGGMGILMVVVLTGGLYWFRPLDISSLNEMTLLWQRQSISPIEYVSNSTSALEELGEPKSSGMSVTNESDVQSSNQTIDGVTEDQSRSIDELEIHVVVLGQTSNSAANIERSLVSQESSSELSISVIDTLAIESNSSQIETVKEIQVGAAANKNRLAVREESQSSSKLYEFWVQVGSFVDKQRADDLDDRLNEKGVVSRISTSISGVDTFYRVRIGPYGTREEADKFLSWIQNFDGLGGSYITKVDGIEG